jgi:hypothetical protein
MAVDAAVDYVLKYAINDFDIDNFKSSNQLSLKQIRKDILKKTNNRESLSKISAVLQQQHASVVSEQNGSGSGTPMAPPPLIKNSGSDAAFYKSALHAAVDEFGSFIQENFIVINEYEKRESISSGSGDNNQPGSQQQQQGKKDSIPSQLSAEEEESLKLKEAIELARQNFYKGKMSMVCLTRAGGYVVKEIKEPTMDSLAMTTSESGATNLLVSNSVTIDSFMSASTGVASGVSSPTQQKQLLEQSVSKNSLNNVSLFFNCNFFKQIF